MNAVFRHGVASGDPTQDAVVIWTRVSSTRAVPIPVGWTMARDRDLRDVVSAGVADADPEADHTLHVDVEGLEPDRQYWYGFEALGERSPTARTRTLPYRTDRLAFAMVSCAKYNAGFFNAYARIAERQDLNFVLHLGDYIYEASQTPPKSQTPSADIGRPFDPEHECIRLEDYRRRYAQHRLDPDLRRLHHTHPFIATVDDHEFADGAWRGGSTEHRPDRDGPWAERVAAALRARREWMPYRIPDPLDLGRIYRTVRLGTLADLLLIDTRTHRDEPAPGRMRHPDHSQLGSDQREWLLTELKESRATWCLLGNGSVFAQIWSDRLPDSVRTALLALKVTNPEFTGPDPDQWDGYPAEREVILQALEDRGMGDVVVLSGDVHIGMASELVRDPFDPTQRPVAVEFVTTSLTSQNVDDKMGWKADTRSVPMEQAFVKALPHVQWCDFDAHGYVVVDVRPDRVRGEWWFVDTVRRPSLSETMATAFEVVRGTPRLVPG
jgi:alkaline phosphatase D